MTQFVFLKELKDGAMHKWSSSRVSAGKLTLFCTSCRPSQVSQEVPRTSLKSETGKKVSLFFTNKTTISNPHMVLLFFMEELLKTFGSIMRPLCSDLMEHL